MVTFERISKVKVQIFILPFTPKTFEWNDVETFADTLTATFEYTIVMICGEMTDKA